MEIELRQLSATLPDGARLPAERDLAIEYDCNFLTVRKALKQLVADGLITRRIGSGTFISPKNTPPQKNPNKKRVGVLVYHHEDAYAFSVLQAIAHRALTESIELRSCWVQDFAEDGLRQAEMLLKEDCVALVLPWFPLTMTDEIRNFVRRCPMPVSLPMLLPGHEEHCFEEKHLFGATMVTGMEGLCHYFAHLGHERVAFLGPDAPRDPILQQKLGAYTCFTSRRNLPTLCGLVPGGSSPVDQLAQRWKKYQGKLAVVSYDDEHALRFMTAMHKIGLSAPNDYCLVGYNNSDASHYSDPPLSTVQQNFDYIGEWMLRNALGAAEGKVVQSTQPPMLNFLIRDTCGGRNRIDPAFKEMLRQLNLEIVDNTASNGAETAAAVVP